MAQNSKLPYIEDDNPMGLPPNDPTVPLPMLAQPPQIPGMLAAQDPGPAPQLSRIGDDTPLGRFAQPILPPAPPMPKVETFAQGERDTRRTRDEQDLQKLNGPHMGQEGSSHPGWGGKILHGLAEAGNVAGDIFAPGTMAQIKGTDLNNDIRRSNDNTDLRDLNREDLSDLSSQATTAKTNAETAGVPQEQNDKHALALSQEGNLDSETEERLHPHAQFEVHDTQAGPLFVNKQTGQAQHLNVNGVPVGPKIQTKTVQLQIGGKPHQVLVNEADGTPIKDLGESGLKPPVTNINQGSWQLEEDGAGKPLLFNNKTGKTEAAPEGLAKTGTHTKANAPYQQVVDDATTAHQLAAEAEAGNAPADVDLALAFFKAMKGTGSGIRFTQSEQNLIMGARSSAGDLQGVAQKVMGGGQKFTPDQRNKILRVIDIHAQQAQNHLNGGGGDGGSGGGGHQIQVGGKTYQYNGSGATDDMKNYTEVKK